MSGHRISSECQTPLGFFIPKINRSKISFALIAEVDADCDAPPDDEIREASEALIQVIRAAWDEGCFERFKNNGREHFKSADRLDELLNAAGLK
jgi:hypothetical protein